MFMNDVAVVIPCYNSSRTIERAIHSALSQSLVSVEVIVIDDCSLDETYAVVEKLAQRENRIKLFRNNINSGPGYSRNVGIDNACSNYIAFLDADDVWFQDKLSCQFKFMQDGKLEFTYHDYYEVILDDFNIISAKFVKSPFMAILPKFYYTRGYGMCLTSMISKTAIGDVRFPVDRSISTEDYCFFLRLLLKGIVGYRYPSALGIYTIAKGSRSCNKFRQGISILRCNIEAHPRRLFHALYYFVIYFVMQSAKRLRRLKDGLQKSPN